LAVVGEGEGAQGHAVLWANRGHDFAPEFLDLGFGQKKSTGGSLCNYRAGRMPAVQNKNAPGSPGRNSNQADSIVLVLLQSNKNWGVGGLPGLRTNSREPVDSRPAAALT